MTFNEAYDKCEKNGCTQFVLFHKELLGENVFLTKAYHTVEKGPISGMVDKSQDSYLQMITYKGDNEFEETNIPYKIMDPEIEGWTAEVFKGDATIDDTNLGRGIVEIKDLSENDNAASSFQRLISHAVKEEFKEDLLKIDIMDIDNYFN